MHLLRLRPSTGLALAVGAAALLLAAGCQMNDNHEKWKQQANQRWHHTRSALVLKMAKQQFETGDLEQAEKSVRKGLKIDPDHAELQLLAGRIALERGELERSFHLFNGAIKADKQAADPHYYKGVVLQRWEQYKQAHLAYQKAYELKPDDVSYLLAMSEMNVQRGRIDEAIEVLEKKRSYFDQNSTLRAALAHLYNMKGRYEKAAGLFKEAALLDPSNQKLTEELGLAQVAAKQNKAAIATLEPLLARHALTDRADLSRALADAYMRTGRRDQARSIYLKLARSEAGGAQDWLRLGKLAWREGDAGSALDAAHRVMDQAPQDAQGYMLAGMTLQKRGDLEQALRMFDRAADLAPKDAQPLILRGLTLQRAGREAAAAQAYQKALNRRPADKRVQQLLKAVG